MRKKGYGMDFRFLLYIMVDSFYEMCAARQITRKFTNHDVEEENEKEGIKRYADVAQNNNKAHVYTQKNFFYSFHETDITNVFL